MHIFARGETMNTCRKAFIALVVFLIVITMTSCSNDKQEQASDTSEEIANTKDIHLMTSWGGVDSKADALKTLIDIFENDNPDYKIINESIFGDDYLPTLKTRISSGNDPDVFGLWPGSDINNLIKAKKVIDMTEILNEDIQWKNSFKARSFKYTTHEGRTYGIPFELVFEGMYINKDLFEKYNVTVPKNYHELKQAIIDFQQHNIIPIAYNSSAEGSYLYQNIIASIGGKEGVAQFLDNGKINNYYIEAMKYVKELYDMGAFPKDALTISSSERNNLFFTKQAAMIVQGSWFASYFEKDDDSVEFIPFPPITKEVNITSGLGCGTFYISSSRATNYEELSNALFFLKFLTSKQSATYFYDNTGLLTNLDIKFSNKYSLLCDQSFAVFNSFKEENITAIPDHIIDRTAWEGIIVQQFPYYLEGNLAPETIWDRAVNEMKIK